MLDCSSQSELDEQKGEWNVFAEQKQENWILAKIHLDYY